jgi:hypothetical protein
MFFRNSMKKVLAARGYKHCDSDDELSRHGDYARHLQYVFSKEFKGSGTKIVDLVFLSADLRNEKIVIGFFRENLSVENGILENSDASIPIEKFSIEFFEKQLDRLIPAGSPLHEERSGSEQF